MKYYYGKHDFQTFERGEETVYLMTNGLGGFSSGTIIGSCSRNDHAVLMGCRADEAPNHRYNMLHRLEEIVVLDGKETVLSSQRFCDDEQQENGYHTLMTFSYEDYPEWHFLVNGVKICKRMYLMPGENTVAITYEMDNHSGADVKFLVRPHFEFVPKGKEMDKNPSFKLSLEAQSCCVKSNGLKLYGTTTGTFTEEKGEVHSGLYYAYDACDGRNSEGRTYTNHSVLFTAAAGEKLSGELIYSMEGVRSQAEKIKDALCVYRRALRETAGYKDETANVLVTAANQFVSYRATTGKQTILAGYPFFEDWGRDTMISLVGCCLSTKQYALTVEILRTFMQYCKKGLMPNLFPEGGQEPGYNTVDAALLFIVTVYEYYERTKDLEFVCEAYPVMKEIIDWYEHGTDFEIGMDEDGLIHAGGGFDQVTWMDVRVGEILPTPRHGKPVEINAYWYNALCMMDMFRELIAVENSVNDKNAVNDKNISEKAADSTVQPHMALTDDKPYAKMAMKAKESFGKLFWNEELGCLKDVISGTKADNQIRCNQIWAVSLPFSVLSRAQEKQVVEMVFRKLYTPVGLRTLSPEDAEFKPVYTGEMLSRDLAYHQGTTWTFPLGGYYLAYLKVNDYSSEAKERVRYELEGIKAALREGCIGQLPEIYDGLEPISSKGCFAQAWSVGEILRVYEALEQED